MTVGWRLTTAQCVARVAITFVHASENDPSVETCGQVILKGLPSRFTNTVNRLPSDMQDCRFFYEEMDPFGLVLRSKDT